MKNGVDPLFFFVAVVAVAGLLSLSEPSVIPPAASANAIRVTDMEGHSVVLAVPAKHVVLWSLFAGAYATLDKGVTHLAAISPYGQQILAHSALGRVFPGANSLPVLAAGPIGPDPEEILALKPDAEFVSPLQAAFLRRLGLPGVIAVDSTAATRLRDGVETVGLAGLVSNRRDEAQALEDRFSRQRADILANLRGRPNALKLIVLWSGPNAFYIPRGHFLDDYFETVGAIDLASRLGGWSGPIDLERLLAADPDMIFLDSPLNDPDPVTPRTLYSDPQYAQYRVLRAVRERRVYTLPTAAFSTRVVDDGLMLRWLAEISYPDEMSRELREQYRDTYREIYGYRLSEDEIDRALLLDENGSSAFYDRFARPTGIKP